MSLVSARPLPTPSLPPIAYQIVPLRRNRQRQRADMAAAAGTTKYSSRKARISYSMPRRNHSTLCVVQRKLPRHAEHVVVVVGNCAWQPNGEQQRLATIRTIGRL